MSGDEAGRLQPVAGDDQDDAIALADLAATHRFAQRAERDGGRRLAEHAGRLREQRDVLDDLVLGDRMDRAAGRARRRDGELAVGGTADRERARDRVRPHRLHLRVVGERRRDRRAAFRLPADQARRRALDEAELEQLAEALMHLREHRARRDRRDDHIRQLPAELLGDLEPERLRAFRVVRAQPDVHERPVELERQLDRQPRAVVVAPFDGEDLRAVDRGRDQLLRLEIGGAEHDGLEPFRRCARGDGVREVARRRAGDRRAAELDRLRRRDCDDAVLERVRRVRGVELQPELADAERLLEPAGADERRPAGREPLLGGRRDRQQRRVPPDRLRPRGDRLAGDGPALLVAVVDRIERAEAAGADPDRVEGELGLTDPAAKCGGGH